MPGGRFFGFVIGGTHPAALAADWLVSAWDQNSGLRMLTPAHSAVEDRGGVAARPARPAGRVRRRLRHRRHDGQLHLPGRRARRGAAPGRVGRRRDGLAGSPGVRVLVGAERHDTIDLALRYLGLGAPEAVAADDQGRVEAAALAAALDAGDGRPTIVCLQAGNVHSGAFDPFDETIAAAHDAGAWVHVDGAFGLFAAASPARRHLVAGFDAADSWASDAHKTLNVPYDCGLAIVRDRAALRAAMGMHGDYLIHDAAGDPFEKVPEISRRGRAFPVWAVLRALGRDGVADLVDGFCEHASAFAEGIAAIDGAEVLNDVVFTQVCVSFGDDDRTRAVVEAMLADGTAWTTGSRWHGRAVLRVCVSNWSTTVDDVATSLAALHRAAGH